MSISSLWLILAVLLFRIVLKKAPKWVRVLLWGFVAIRLVCPFTVESALSLIPSAQTIAPEILLDATPAVETGIPIINQAVNPIISESGTPTVGASVNPMQIVFGIGANLWLMGMIGMLMYGLISYLLLRKSVKTAVPMQAGIYQSECVSSPFVLGIIKPRIYLPYAISEQSIHHVIAHEKAHIRRKDHWWKPLGFWLLTVHWFNPLIWLAYILLCRDIELACDEKVIKELGVEERADYSAALLSSSIRHNCIAACPVAFGEVSVKSRIKSVLSYQKPGFWIMIVALLLCCVVAVCFLTDPRKDSYTLKIIVPAGSQEQFVYAEEEISPLGKYITVSSGDGLGDTEVLLKTVKVKTETAYEPAYLTPGLPVKLEAEKGGWFRIGINMQNPTNEDIVVYVIVENVEVRISSLTAEAQKWFDYTEDPSQMSYEKELEIQLEAFPDVTFRYTPYEITAVGSDPNNRTTVISGLPIWNAYFSDLTGDGFPEICSEVSFGSGTIDNRVLICDYANGVSYKLADRGVYDYMLRIDDAGYLYVDKKVYNSNELAASGKLTFKDGTIQLEGTNTGPVTILRAKLLEIHNGYFIVEPVEGSWELSSADKIAVPMNNMYPSPEPMVGDILEIEYDGQLMETYPAEIRKPYSIRVVEERRELQIMIDPADPVIVQNTITGEVRTVTDLSDIKMIQTLISAEWWAEGNPACDNDFKVTINGESYWYHSDCGTLNDIHHDKCYTLNEFQKNEISRIFGVVQNIDVVRYYLTIGAEGVKSIELSMPGSSGGCMNADGSLFKKGERVWLENLDGYSDLRGLAITALGKDGEIIWEASIPDAEENAGFTHLRIDDWVITNIK